MNPISIEEATQNPNDLILGLTYISYAYNRDLGMDHGSIAGVLNLSTEMAAEFEATYKNEESQNENLISNCGNANRPV